MAADDERLDQPAPSSSAEVTLTLTLTQPSTAENLPIEAGGIPSVDDLGNVHSVTFLDGQSQSLESEGVSGAAAVSPTLDQHSLTVEGVNEHHRRMGGEESGVGPDFEAGSGGVSMSLEIGVGDSEGDFSHSASECVVNADVREEAHEYLKPVGNDMTGENIDAVETEAPGLPTVNEEQSLDTANREADFMECEGPSYALPQEKRLDFSASDFIWGKVRSHPWWPGQIFDPSDASELATRHKKKGAFLVSYFGDQTFAWCEKSQLKPFYSYFQQMAKQSSTDAFLNAVKCALDEVSRQTTLGLTCSCMGEEVSNRLKNPKIDNAGIREGAIVSGAVNASLFEPVKLLEYIKELALFPLIGGEQLALVIAKSQLLAFYYSKGYLELATFDTHVALLGNEEDSLPVRELSKDSVQLATPSLESGEEKTKRHGRPRKQVHLPEDTSHHSGKRKSVAERMTRRKASNFTSVGRSSSGRKSAGSLGLPPSDKKRKLVDSFSDDSVRTRVRQMSSLSDSDFRTSSEKTFGIVGDRIRRVAGKLAGSPPILKVSGESFQKNGAKVELEKDQTHPSRFYRSPKQKQKKGEILKEFSSPNVLLLQLRSAACDPLEGYRFLHVVVSFFTDFRNSIHLNHSGSDNNDYSGRTCEEKSLSPKNASVELASNETEDSYWTDMVIHGTAKEKASGMDHKRKAESQLDTPKRKRGRPPGKQSKVLQSSAKFDSDQKGDVDSNEGSEEDFSPTALILNFNEIDYIPSEEDLNKLFSCYGPLKETEVLKNTNQAAVVFLRRSDAEIAYSSAEKFSMFGPALVSYCLKYLPLENVATRTTEKDDIGQTTDVSEVPGIRVQVEDGE